MPKQTQKRVCPQCGRGPMARRYFIQHLRHSGHGMSKADAETWADHVFRDPIEAEDEAGAPAPAPVDHEPGARAEHDAGGAPADPAARGDGAGHSPGPPAPAEEASAQGDEHGERDEQRERSTLADRLIDRILE